MNAKKVSQRSRGHLGWSCASVAIVAVLLTAAVAHGGGEPRVRQQFVTSPDGAALIQVIPVSGPGLATPEISLSGVQPSAGAGSATWEQLPCPGGVYLRAVSMGSPQVGFAAGELGKVLRTTDGGNTWQYVLNQGFPYYYYGVQAFNENTVVITGFQNQTGEGVLRWSDDGGDTWGPVVSLSAPTYFDWLYFVRFIDDNNGVIQAWGGGVHYTYTGGRTAGDWSFSQPTQNWWQGTFTYLDDGRVWMTGYDNFRSHDGGAAWTRLPDADPLFDGANSIIANGKGYISGGTISPSVSGWVYGTTNGGDSWTPAPVLTTAYPIRALLCLDDQRAWAVGGNLYTNVGGIWGTTDGGDTWTLEQSTGAELLDITAVRVNAYRTDLYAVGMVSQIWRTQIQVPPLLGDLNCDGTLDAFDIDPFVLALTDPVGYAQQYPNCDRLLADCNGDGVIDAFDIDPFVLLLTGG